MGSWSWTDVIASVDFWTLYCKSGEPIDDTELRRELFFIGMLDTIAPATDAESEALASAVPEGPSRVRLLKHLALGKLPRKRIELEFPGPRRWSIEFCPQAAIAHYLDNLLVGSDDAHASLPILRLDEVRAMVASCVRADVPSRFLSALLLPVAGLAEDELDQACAMTDIPQVHARVREQDAVRWSRDERFGWINDAEDSIRNPSGAHHGSAWRRLAEKTRNPAHAAQADAIEAEAWKPEVEYARVASFFDAIGVAGERST